MISKDGDSGYPGSISIAAKLSLSPISGELRIEYSGMSTKKTPIDISNNILLNLAGHNKGIYFPDSDITCFFKYKNTRFILEYIMIPKYFLGKSGLFDHFVQINAERYIPFSNFSSHSGGILSVAKTPFDLRWSKHLGRAIFRLPKDGKGKMRNSSICINSYMKSTPITLLHQ